MNIIWLFESIFMKSHIIWTRIFIFIVLLSIFGMTYS